MKVTILKKVLILYQNKLIMKNNNVLYISLFTFLLLTSCAHEKNAVSGWDYSAGAAEVRMEDGKGKEIQKKVIYSSTINLQVKSPDTANVQIEQIAKKYNGYVQQNGTSMCIIRVEEKSLKPAVEDICDLGYVSSKHSYGEDVTAQYSDYAIRLENAEKSRLRYLELLSKAENVEAALKVERELERLNETIELMKGQMNRIDHLSSYSTITVYLKEKPKPGIIGYIGIGLYKAVKWLFVRN